MTIEFKAMEEYKTIDLEMLIVYIETIYFILIAKHNSTWLIYFICSASSE